MKANSKSTQHRMAMLWTTTATVTALDTGLQQGRAMRRWKLCRCPQRRIHLVTGGGWTLWSCRGGSVVVSSILKSRFRSFPSIVGVS